MRRITLLFAVLLSLAGVMKANADELTVYDGTGSSTYYPVHGNYADTNNSLSEFIIPASALSEMSGASISKMTFYISSVAAQEWTSTFTVYMKEIETDAYESSSAIGDADATVVYEGLLSGTASTMDVDFTTNYDYTGENLLIGFKVTTAGSVWKSATFVGETQSSYTAFRNKSSNIREKFIPKTTFTYSLAPTEGPALAVKDGSSKLTSPYAYNFGLATSGTTKTFTLSNPGTEDLGVSVSETGSFGATLSATTISAGGEVTLTVTMPDATGSSAVMITPAAGSGIDPFVINVSGTVRDANKVYLDFADGQMPEGWTSASSSTYYSWAVSEGYIGYGGTSSSYPGTLTSPKLTFAKDELIAFETARYGSSTWYTPSVTVEYSLDGSTWTAIGSAFTDDVYGTWTSRSVTIPVDGVKYIRFNGWYVYLRNIYGGEVPNEPNMKVTQPASLDFGVITEATAKTFTIANTGKATLEGINVTSSNSIFTITGAPASLEAGASAEVTITMAASTTGALSSDITVSATGMDDVQFTVTGVVLPEGLMVVDFNDDQLPARWTNASWTFADGAATGKSSSAYLTTPKLLFSEGDMLVVKAKRADSDATDYITVQGSSDNGETWSAYSKKISGSEGLAYPDYGTLVLTDIPTTVTKLRFVGYYVVVDEIAGLTYAPVLSVTQDATAVATPANYDFGESAADATVTYRFTNAGAGTINITNVAVTGDGAAAYSTNWTESVVAPFDLVITRTYDSSRTAAQAAVITVTTSEGDFVINVTGTDKAANDPELAVTPAEDAAFGVVTEAVTKTYTVTNAGTGLLTVSIVSDNEMFTVSAAELADIPAGESKTFDVTFTPASETYGVFTANVKVTPAYDETAAVTIAASAKVKDPSLWSEDFAANALPTGWDAGTNWSFADGAAKAKYAYGSTTYLTTPTLSVAAETDELSFDYKANANYVSVKIQVSKDNAAFTDLSTTIGSLNTGDAGTYTITGLEAGVYQFRFANDDYELDNFEGFKLFVPEHKTDIMASSIPESKDWNMTMKEGRSFEATVTLKENAGKEEAVKAELYMGEDVIGSVETTLEAYGSATLTITATPATAATEGAQMYIKVTYAGGELTTAAETRYVAALTYLTLDETSSEAVVAGTYDHVTLKRTFAKDWNTVCLPFTISDVEAFFGTGAKAYEFKEYTSEGELSFNTVTTLTASYPYIVFLPEALTGDIALTDITIASSDDEAFYKSSNNVYFRGTYAPLAAGGMEGKYGVTDDARIRKGTAEATIKGFRAYFEIPEDAPVKALVFQGDLATDVRIVPVDSQEVEGLFDLAGRRVQKAHKGIFIQNGKKVVVK